MVKALYENIGKCALHESRRKTVNSIYLRVCKE